MMPEHRPGDHPGHLDIDAVSAFVDRDLEPVELTTIEMHISQCPACEREVLEIRTTVFLLSGLPEYEPRRSFLLGQEHARASRRERPRAAQPALSPQLPASQPRPGSPASISGPPASGWMSALHVAALMAGVLLLLVTVGDLTGIIGSAPASMQLAAPTTVAEEAPREALPAMDSAPSAPMAAVAPDAEADMAPAPAPASSFQESAADSGGTFGAVSASDEVSEGQELARVPPRLAATSNAAASVTQAIPTPGAGSGAEPAATGGTDLAQTAADGQPSRLRIVQLALALILAWLVVSIAGARWIRRLR